jgi:hypothetical protein
VCGAQIKIQFRKKSVRQAFSRNPFFPNELNFIHKYSKCLQKRYKSPVVSRGICLEIVMPLIMSQSQHNPPLFLMLFFFYFQPTHRISYIFFLRYEIFIHCQNPKKCAIPSFVYFLLFTPITHTKNPMPVSLANA